MTARGPRPTGRPIVVTHALRTPIGRYLGGFASLSAADLGSSLVASLVGQAGIDANLVDHLIFGNGRQAGGGPNVARQIAVRAGLGQNTTALTLNMACASGLKAIEQAADAVEMGRARIAVAGGVESMSGLPFFLPQMRTGYRLGHAKVVDSMYQDGFQCPLAGMLMGATAEVLAREFEIDRAEQDAFAIASQHKCQSAREAGRFKDEIAPVDVVGRKGDVTTVDTDEHPRDDARIESLAKLPTVFDRERGTVTAGNSSGITDGAAALLVMDADTAEELGLAPLAFIGGSSEAGVEPERMGIGPVPAMAKLEAHNGLTPGDYDLIELNEAFAAQVLACDRMAPLPMERVNVNGGSIALGHPIGATGARIVVTLLHEMQRRAVANGLATLCVSGGMGMAMHLSRRGL